MVPPNHPDVTGDPAEVLRSLQVFSIESSWDLVHRCMRGAGRPAGAGLGIYLLGCQAWIDSSYTGDRTMSPDLWCSYPVRA
jgi:hypothetical protein